MRQSLSLLSVPPPCVPAEEDAATRHGQHDAQQQGQPVARVVSLRRLHQRQEQQQPGGGRRSGWVSSRFTLCTVDTQQQELQHLSWMSAVLEKGNKWAGLVELKPEKSRSEKSEYGAATGPRVGSPLPLWAPGHSTLRSTTSLPSFLALQLLLHPLLPVILFSLSPVPLFNL
ncbi:hypothetical protein EYF80_002888 [Liparis tanakae]|uniref:Uncharacterized protein n=1 Tax=Liparis tanakae TaxID=230148 RepID=A0A4Z2J8L0_9TELE|nr:hypothetical protein EYF80_002888 [Liparis tanakae]